MPTPAYTGYTLPTGGVTKIYSYISSSYVRKNPWLHGYTKNTPLNIKKV